MEVRLEGVRPDGVTAKDLILAVIGHIGVAGAAGHVIEYTGPVITALSMEERMTVCNMSIEAGARAGLIAPDETTWHYLRGREMGPTDEELESLIPEWRELATDEGVTYDRSVVLDVSGFEPQVTWGTNPGMVAPISGSVPDPELLVDEDAKEGARRALAYMDLEAGTRIEAISIDRVFIGSCTNGRISDLREAARVAETGQVPPNVRALVVPGSQAVARQAEEEHLDEVFRAHGFQWREPGCSMCLAMNPDKLEGREVCASSSNRNFKGRQGSPTGRTLLMSPAMVAAAAIHGQVVDVREVL